MIIGDIEVSACDFPEIHSVKIPDIADRIIVEYEYEPFIEGNRSGHPDTWTPDEPEYIGLTAFYWFDDDGVPQPSIAWHDLSNLEATQIESIILSKLKEQQ